MNRSKFVINVTIIGIGLIVLIPTIYKIVTEHNNRLTTVTTKRIQEAAKNCKTDEKCLEEKITLKELYDKKYLKKESNPITKEYYNENSYIDVKKDYNFVVVD